jgi:uncharacterized protein
MADAHKYTNSLIHESSPYLLQHAHNPVSWYPWGEEALRKASAENKLILISIGYSACHWCHVMEKESFEDEDTAAIMNEHFVCIKVDREERPDIDQIYMLAVQLMTGQGGWPLNCFALPDGRPVYGGTYFSNSHWKQVLRQLAEFYRNNRAKAEEYASELTKGIHSVELVELQKETPVFSMEEAQRMYDGWKKQFDHTEGGPDKAPKFPMPSNYLFFLKYYYFTRDKELLDYIHLTLEKMAFGGLYDQLGGGFCRYSTDREWKVPHFEKMLYDNAQLVTLYSEAFRLTGKELYRQVVYETLEFADREMSAPEGGFYSALDADSEGEEGRYYVWRKAELEELLGDDFSLFSEYYNVNSAGCWEHGNYILLRKRTDEELARSFGMDTGTLKAKISALKRQLLEVRGRRVRPGLDDKQLTSWNALMIKGYADAYMAFGENRFLEKAVKAAAFILNKVSRPDSGLWHSYKNGKASINGYLEDYAFMIEALIALYQQSFDEKWIFKAKELAEYCKKHFFSQDNGMFFFTSSEDPPLIARKAEIHDNVIPSSNSVMAANFFRLGLFFGLTEYRTLAEQMLNNVRHNMVRYGSAYSHWGIFLMDLANPFYEVAIVGKECLRKRRELVLSYHPEIIIAGAEEAGELPLVKGRFAENRTLIYVCRDHSCRTPVESVAETLDMISSRSF